MSFRFPVLIVVLTGILAGPVWAEADEEQIDCCVGMRGDMNYDGEELPDPVDLSYLVDFLFSGGLPPLCRTEADFNGDGSIEPDPVDLSALVDYLFSGGPDPAGCVQLGVKSTLLGDPSSPFVPFALHVHQPGIPDQGVAMKWSARYSLDPGQPATFQYRWRIYGPYTDNEINFVKSNVFGYKYETYDGRTFDMGDTVWVCRDGIFDEYDASEEPCQRLIINQQTPSTYYGEVVPSFDVEAPNFKGLFYDRVAMASGTPEDPWLLASGDTAVGLFDYDRPDSTYQRNFVIWLQAADLYGNIESTPVYKTITAVNAAFEYDVLVVDMTGSAGPDAIVGPPPDTIRSYWSQRLGDWLGPGRFDLSRDYKTWAGVSADIPITSLMSHKMCIVHADGSFSGSLIHTRSNLFLALARGVSCWLIDRMFVGTTLSTPLSVYDIGTYPTGTGKTIGEYFGVVDATFNGWACSALAGVGITDPFVCPEGRIEDFIGAQGALPGFPDLAVDSSLLHNRYTWGFAQEQLDSAFAWEPYKTDPPLGALPCVTPLTAASGAEVVYQYESLYGSTHPFGFSYSFEGLPVGLRFQGDGFRSSYFSFTPLSIEEAAMDVVIDSMLTWLYEPWE